MIPSCQDSLSKFWKAFTNVQGLRSIFKKLDADGDAEISRQEMMKGAGAAGLKLSADEVETIFILSNKDGHGQMDFAEFAEVMIPSAPRG